jgi:hypothetical protein
MGGRFMRKHVVVGILVAAVAALATSAEAQKVETKLGLYVTAKEAYDMWRANPDTVKILDVRTLAESVFTPNKGLQANLELSWFAEALGGDFDYGVARIDFRYYWALGKTWVLGFRGDFDAIGDEAPFFALAWVKLRGVPAFRYLGNYVVTFEVEPRYKIDERWSVVAFAGAGRAATEISNLNDADKVYGIGGGFRYLLARKLGLGVGIDIARGPEDTVGYLTIGSAW